MSFSLLVVTPCSASKRIRVHRPPKYEDLVDRERRHTLLEKHAAVALPAAQLYNGQHHRIVMEAVRRLRKGWPQARVGVALLSAGFGVVAEDDVIVPYDATFVGLPAAEIVQRGRALGIRPALSRLLAGYEAAVFLLGREYLAAIEAPIGSATIELYLTARAVRLIGPRVVCLTASAAEARLLGVAPRVAKAGMFAHLVDVALTVGWSAAVGQFRREFGTKESTRWVRAQPATSDDASRTACPDPGLPRSATRRSRATDRHGAPERVADHPTAAGRRAYASGV